MPLTLLMFTFNRIQTSYDHCSQQARFSLSSAQQKRDENTQNVGGKSIKIFHITRRTKGIATCWPQACRKSNTVFCWLSAKLCVCVCLCTTVTLIKTKGSDLSSEKCLLFFFQLKAR